MEQYKIYEENGIVTCLDLYNGVVCTFQKGKFNETQKFEISNEQEMLTAGASGIAHIINAIAMLIIEEYPEYL